jgi:hypothetical protein
MLRTESPTHWVGAWVVQRGSLRRVGGGKETLPPAETRTPFVHSLAQSIYQATPIVDSFRNDQLCIFRQF